MGKFVLFVVLALVVLWWLRGARRSAPKAGAGPAAKPPAQAIVPCAHCGVHLPRSDAVAAASSDTLFYCTEAHRLAAERR